jgi:hypothetical protein
MATRRKKTKTPDELTQRMEAAKAADKYMVAVWSVKDRQIHLYRLTNKFPVADIPEALAMLRLDLLPQNDSTPPA